MNCAALRIPVHEVQTPDGKNRERFRTTFEEVPALRRKSGCDDFRASHSVQGLGMVCDRLCGEGRRRRYSTGGKVGCERVERVRDQGNGGERLRRKGNEREEDRQEKRLGRLIGSSTVTVSAF